MAIETELKLTLPPRAAARVLVHPVIEALASGAVTQERLLSVYYDTPKLELWALHASVRLRRTPTGWIQTVKRGGTAAGGLHQREELDAVVSGQALDWSGFGDAAALNALIPVGIRRRLRPVFVTEFDRAVRVLKLADGADVELALDRGHIVAGTARANLCELELELKRGDRLVLFDIAAALIEQLPLRPAYRSKAERGFLLAGLARAPVKAERLVMDESFTIGRTAAGIIGAGLAQLQGNEEGMLVLEDIEYLHQMRVGVRRLRSCCAVFARVLAKGALDPVRAELKWLGARLGPARDWDVFLFEMLPQLRKGLSGVAPAEALQILTRAAGGLRERARRSARLAVNSRRTARLLLELGRLAAGGGALRDDPSTQAAAKSFTAALLARRMERVLKHVDRRKPGTPAEMHALRIAVKKLRYAVEFFGGLYDASRVKPFRDRLVKLQDSLGAINDANSMLARVQESCGAEHALVDCVSGWSAHFVYSERTSFRALWRQFRRTRAFW